MTTKSEIIAPSEIVIPVLLSDSTEQGDQYTIWRIGQNLPFIPLKTSRNRVYKYQMGIQGADMKQQNEDANHLAHEKNDIVVSVYSGKFGQGKNISLDEEPSYE
ncbi:MAG: hypothetical protein ACQET5_15435 [Halobacteriota archaeon]